ncbi:MAG: hypothetical protein HYS27_02435 [Deltaproteobacteria bacterium]|nr:hypothetical protein [Deltaproteobacteria bacterium]
MTATDTKDTTLAALAAHGWNLGDTADALGIKRDSLRTRMKRLSIVVPDGPPKMRAAPVVEPAPTATAAQPTTITDRKPKPKPAPKKPATFVVMKGGVRTVRVADDHPAAVAAMLTKELGGATEATPTGLRLRDPDGRTFATVLAGRAAAHFFVTRVPLKVAKRVAGDLAGEWGYCWPTARRGSATLRHVETVTRTLVRTLMKLAVGHGVDRRRRRGA